MLLPCRDHVETFEIPTNPMPPRCREAPFGDDDPRRKICTHRQRYYVSGERSLVQNEALEVATELTDIQALAMTGGIDRQMVQEIERDTAGN
jgi:hypothetical protein